MNCARVILPWGVPLDGSLLKLSFPGAADRLAPLARAAAAGAGGALGFGGGAGGSSAPVPVLDMKASWSAGDIPSMFIF